MERYRGKTGDDITLDPDGDIVLYADAQATIAALQAQLEQVQEERSKYIQAVGLATTCAADMQIDTSHPIEMMQEVCTRFTQRTAELERVRGLVKTYADAKIDFDDKRLQEDHHAWRERYNKLVEAENALLQHRQGMEG